MPQRRADYGSAATEIAICLTRIGVALRPDLEVLELSGELVATVAVPSELGEARYIGGVWVGRLSAGEVIVLGSQPSLERWRIAFGTCPHRTNAVLSLIGPRAEQLLGETGFASTGEGVRLQRARLFETDVVVLRESRTWLTVIAARTADPVSNGFLRAGRPFGALPVGRDAVDRLTASRRFAISA
jgi:hypothetical protein